MIAILGDVHFASLKEYHVKIGEAMISWFSTWKYNNPENELILTGDIVHTAVNGGLVIAMLERFVNASRFAVIHIVPGNHDMKRHENVVQLAYEFLRKRPNVVIYDRDTVATIQGKKVLMLPHYIPQNSHEPPMLEYYSSLYKKYPDTYDLLVGHFLEEKASFGGACVKNLDKLSVKKICLGHLHTRMFPEYIGSMYANKSNEADPTRAAWIFDNAMNCIEDPLPVFCEYLSVEYPEPLPESNAVVPIYTVNNCPTEAQALRQYGPINIRKVIHALNTSTKSSDEIDKASIENFNVVTLFKEFLQTRDTPIDRRVASLCLSLLTEITN